MLERLNPKDLQLLRGILHYLGEQGIYPPTGELVRTLGLDRYAVWRSMGRLEAAGLIQRTGRYHYALTEGGLRYARLLAEGVWKGDEKVARGLSILEGVGYRPGRA